MVSRLVTFLFAGIIGNPGPVGNQCITPATGQPEVTHGHVDTALVTAAVQLSKMILAI